MIKKSTVKHLRIPFSFFLSPVFFLSLAVIQLPWNSRILLVFFLIHVLIYPASNGYNSYFDRDKGSIGGLRNPPAVTRELYWVALIFDAVAIVIGLWVSPVFGVLLFLYGLASKAYSHPLVRLKKYPWAGWLIAGLFQGYFTFIMCAYGLGMSSTDEIWGASLQIPAILSSLLLFGSYPMTQIYQHVEDADRGDYTLSMLLGIRGTFHFTAAFFTISMIGFWFFFLAFHSISWALAFQVSMLPVLLFFMKWYFDVRKDEAKANFDQTMRLNLLSSVMFNLFFLVWWYYAKG